MKSRALTITLLLFMSLVLGACAAGKKFSYHDINVNMQARGDSRLMVTALDHRYFVLDKTKVPTWVGLLRDAWNAPFDVHTASRQPLARDVSAVLQRAVADAGYTIVDPGLSHDAPLDDVEAAMTKEGVDRALVLILRNWWTDTAKTTQLKYHLQMKVFGADGRLLAEQEVKGEEALSGQDAMVPGSNARTVSAEAMKKHIESLLNDAKVVEALGSGA